MSSSLLYSNAILIDSSAAIALHCPSDASHTVANDFFRNSTGILWVALNATAHESYTRTRYDKSFESAITIYDFLKGEEILQMAFDCKDELQTRSCQ